MLRPGLPGGSAGLRDGVPLRPARIGAPYLGIAQLAIFHAAALPRVSSARLFGPVSSADVVLR